MLQSIYEVGINCIQKVGRAIVYNIFCLTLNLEHFCLRITCDGRRVDKKYFDRVFFTYLKYKTFFFKLLKILSTGFEIGG